MIDVHHPALGQGHNWILYWADLQIQKFLDHLWVVPGRQKGNPPGNLGCKQKQTAKQTTWEDEHTHIDDDRN